MAVTKHHPVVCTANEPDGWSHSVMISLYDKTVTLDIHRWVGNKRVHHPMSKKVWKYRTHEEQDIIEEKCREIGLMVGSLRLYGE